MYSGSSLPPSGRSLSLYPPNSSYGAKSELSASSNMRPIGPRSSSQQDHKMSFNSNQINLEISQMPVTPPKDLCHRRTHSDILTLLNEISFDGDLGGSNGLSVFNETDQEDLPPEYLVLDKFNLTSESSALPMEERTTSSYMAPAVSKKPGPRLQHSQSLRVVTSIEKETLEPGSESPSSDEPISAANLADLAVADPKRAKRIWANRQSAARSKERKMRYIGELQSKVQSMQAEKTSLSMQFNLLQRDTTGVASENIELKLQLQSIEQQVHLQDALNNSLKEEIQHLKVLTGQAAPNGQALMHTPSPYGANQQYHTNNHAAAQPLHYQFRQHQLDQFQPCQLLLH